MCANVKNISDRENLFQKQIQLEDENKRLWEEIRIKNEQIVSLNDKLVLQEDLLKSQTSTQKLLNEYLQTIRCLQGDLIFIQNENKVLEQKFYDTHVKFRELFAKGNPDQNKIIRENTVLKMKIHTIEKELRRYVHLWDKNVNLSADIITARDTIVNLEQKLYECQSVTTDSKQAKNKLVEVEEKLKTSDFMNIVLKEELDKTKSNLQTMILEQSDMKTQLTKCTELVAKLRKENTSMECFIEKSFRLEGALAELDDLNVMLKKQETMLAVLFDENQSLKDGISRMFEDMNILKDRNWKLEKYATEIEDSFYMAEKNVDTLERKLDYYEAMEKENEKMKITIADMSDHIRDLENDNYSLTARLDDLEKRLQIVNETLNSFKNDNQKLTEENSALRVNLTGKNIELLEENEYLKSELNKLTIRMNDFHILQNKYDEVQKLVRSLKSKLQTANEENGALKDDVDHLRRLIDEINVERDRCKDELRRVETKYRQLEYALNHAPVGYGDYRK